MYVCLSDVLPHIEQRTVYSLGEDGGVEIIGTLELLDRG